MTKSSIFIGIAVSFAAGILIASRWGVPSLYLYCFAAAAVAWFGITAYFGMRRAALAGLFFAAASCGAMRLQWSQVPNEYASMLGEKRQLEGHIVEDVDVRTNTQMITFSPNGFSQRVLITTSKYNEYAYGDWAVAEGKVEEAKNFDDFDYQKYLQRFNVYAVMKYPKILVLKNNRGNRFLEILYAIKHGFTKNIASKLPEPAASLMLGILIGARKTLPPDIVDNFNATGVSHIIAISGYNISIIVGALNRLAHGIGRKASFWLSLFLICSFVIITGASASVVRAAVMGFLLLLSFVIGRQYAVGPTLFFAGFIMLVLNPKILFWDIGFQLSFAATAGIVYGMPLFERATEKWGSWFGLKSIILVTMSAIIATLPLILLYFGRLSTVAPLVNMLILPIIPITMLLGFLEILPWVGAGFAFVSHLMLSYILFVTAAFARLPFASVSLPVSPWAFGILYASILAGYWILRLKFQARSRDFAAVEAVEKL